MTRMDHAATPATDPGVLVVGWREQIALPEWDIPRIRAKIDTGARTSAIHVHEIQEQQGDLLRFLVVIRERPSRQCVWVEAPLVRSARVRPSSGVRQKRPVVSTLMLIGDRAERIELSLVCRKGMLCRMLIGRKALAHGYLVDPSRKYILRPRAQGRPKTRKPAR